MQGTAQSPDIAIFFYFYFFFFSSSFHWLWAMTAADPMGPERCPSLSCAGLQKQKSYQAVQTLVRGLAPHLLWKSKEHGKEKGRMRAGQMAARGRFSEALCSRKLAPGSRRERAGSLARTGSLGGVIGNAKLSSRKEIRCQTQTHPKTQTVTEGKCAGLILEPCNPRSERAATSARITRGHVLGQEGMVRALGSARCRRDHGEQRGWAHRGTGVSLLQDPQG